MLGVNRVSRAFADFGLTFDHDRDPFAATWCVHHAFAFLKGGEKGDVFTLGNRENFFFAQIAEIDAVPKREHICLRSSRANPVLCVDTCLLYTSPSPRDS
eukprot:TRINITY_DN19755_c0_g1_i3.p2 TRINITY_DN19755_c0_g1~~TRINITY_DN19755_c0_g1_i3.p2  ORF type:complete len:100 (-),score=12.12 TRINITY_DN19755_c0_g1_i3:50-349(-)